MARKKFLVTRAAQLAAQNFSKCKQRKLNGDRVRVTNLLIAAKQDLIAGDESAKTSIGRLESELQMIHCVKNEAVKIRSRTRWLEEGEKRAKYFFKLKSSCAQKNLVASIYYSAGVEVSSQKEIEQAHLIFISSCTLANMLIPNYNRNSSLR